MFDRLGSARASGSDSSSWSAGWSRPPVRRPGAVAVASGLRRRDELPAARRRIAGRPPGHRHAFPQRLGPDRALIVFSRPGGLTDADRAAIEGLRATSRARPSGRRRALRHRREHAVAGVDVPQHRRRRRAGPGRHEHARRSCRAPTRRSTRSGPIWRTPGVLPAASSPRSPARPASAATICRPSRTAPSRTTLVTIILVILVLLLIYRAPLAALAPLMTIGSAFLVSRGVLGFLAQAGLAAVVGPGLVHRRARLRRRDGLHDLLHLALPRGAGPQRPRRSAQDHGRADQRGHRRVRSAR
jgi:hypothetical protein